MRKLLSLIIISLVMTNIVNAGPGDTTIVKTLSFDDITKRRGWYILPPQNTDWHKILMYYTLKCDEATTQDGYPCGEWDYTTYTNLYEYDNLDAPYYTVGNLETDSIKYTTSPIYNYFQSWQYFTVFDNISNETESISGSGVIPTIRALQSSYANNRAQYIWLASELINAGVNAGEIHKLKLDISSIGSELNHLKIRMKNTDLAELSESNYENDSLITVYELNTSFSTTGWNEIAFTTPFTWDGASNIAIDISFKNDSPGTDNIVNSDTTSYNSAVYTSKDDGYLSFFTGDYVEVPNDAFSGIDNNITISFWQFGDPNLQPSNSYIFEGRDSNNQRVINAHLPWSNSRIYWDAGNSGTNSYDRIDKAANFEDFAGQWNHWAMTKNSASGEMKIFLNGSLWHSGSGKTRSMSGISKFLIGGSANSGSGVYNGFINEFRIWDIDLPDSTIAEWMKKDITTDHPNYANLIACYRFDEMSGSVAVDYSPNGFDGDLIGIPDWKYTDGANAFRNMVTSTERPNISFVQGIYTTHPDSVLVTDSLLVGGISIFTKQAYIDTSVSGISMNILDTVFGWYEGYSYTYNPDGTISDSIFIVAENTVYNSLINTTHQIQNYVTPYGIGLDLGPDGFRWVYDVTDYGPLLHDTIELSAGNQQELIDLKFIFIEGTPVRDVIDFKTIWLGDWGHANIADDVSLPAVDVDLNPDADMFTIKTRTTGHWFGEGENCAEFCPKNHNLKINGTMQFEWLNWTECADNPVYPQGGTWIYDRAGWCPGSFADTYDHDITQYVTPGEVVSIDYGMESYPAGMGEGNYRISVQLISHSNPNFILDAAVEDIISPNNWEYHNRFNPTCGRPVIKIGNTGSTTLTSLQINYGANGDLSNTYDWSGSLAFNESEEVTLSPMNYDFDGGSNQVFEVSVSNPNGGTDEYSYNNNMSSSFELPEVFDEMFFVYLRTNSYANETYYHIYDAEGNIVFERDSLDNNTLYYDTIILPSGCYELILYDTDDDGINFWANDDGNGYIYFRRNDGTPYEYLQHDFGKFLRLPFKISGPDAGITTQNFTEGQINIYPNPSKGNFVIDIDMQKKVDLSFNVTDITGSEVYNIEAGTVIKEQINLDLSHLSKGVYIIRANTETESYVKRIVIE